MTDVYAAITHADPATLEKLGDAMEISAADEQHRAMVEAYLADLDLTSGARVLEVGCGTGAIARLIAAVAGEVVGVDPSAALLRRARALSAALENVFFEEADGRALPYPDASFDAVVLHRVLCHAPEPERVLAEAVRVLRRGGRIAVFDGDYATITLANGPDDPLQTCVGAFAPEFVNDPWIARRLVVLVAERGLDAQAFRSHGYVQIREPRYMLSIADRGADVLASSGRIGGELAAALKGEARRRVAEQAFYGHIAYVSLTAQKP